MKKTLVSMTLLLMTLTCFAQAQTSDRAGSVGVLFLKLGMSPRAAAMGNTYVAVADDISGVFLNPVSIVNLEGRQVFASEVDYLVDTKAVAGAVCFPLPPRIGGVGAVHYTGFFSGDMKMTTAEDIDGTATHENFSWNELAVGATYARSFTDKFSVGLSAKYVRTDVASFYSQTFAFDVGTIYRTGFRNLRLGMSATNFGPDMKVNGKYANTFISGIWLVSVEEEYGYYPLPILLQVGIADELYKNDQMRLTGALDFSHPNDLAERIHVGAEFAYNEMLFLRGGFFMDMDKSKIPDRIDPDNEALDRYNEFRFGAGVKVRNFTVDYAWQDVESLGNVHRIGVSFRM